MLAGSGTVLKVGLSKITLLPFPVLELMTAKEPTVVPVDSRVPVIGPEEYPPPAFETLKV
jgi:hypothetical protein